MDTGTQFFVAYAGIMMAFVAFTTITATLRQSSGHPLSPIQYLLFRFFSETGLIHVVEAMVPVALIQLGYGDETVWLLATYVAFLPVLIYLPFYVHRRRQTKAPVPLLSVAVMIGYGAAILMIGLTLTGLFWEPSRTIITLYLMWAMVSSVAVYFMVLGGFVAVEE
jgi:hypothetical protein